MRNVTKFGIGLGSLALASVGYGSISFNIAAGTLRDSEGTPINSGLVILAIDTNRDGFATPSEDSFLQGDDLEVARWDFSEGGGIDGEFLASKVIPIYNSVNWAEGDPLALFWFPDLDKNATQPGDGTKFGAFADPTNSTSGDVWTMPADNVHLYSLQFFAEGSILNTTSFASEYVAQASLDEDSSLELPDVMTDPMKASATSNLVSWSPAGSAQGYTVQRRIVGQTTWKTLGAVSGTSDSFIDDELSPGYTYEYQVIAENGLNALESYAGDDDDKLFSERSVFASVAARSMVEQANARWMFGQVDIVGNASTKNMLFQGSGPWMLSEEVNVPGALPDLDMKVWKHPNPDFTDRETVATNDNWMEQAVPEDALTIDELQADFGPTKSIRRANVFDDDPPSKDAAWVGQVDRGIPYTFMIRPKGEDVEGPGLIGIHNVEGGESGTFSNSDNRIAALVTRGFLGGGVDRAKKMFGEFSIEGNVPKTVLIRGLGPNLTYYGLGDDDENGNPIESERVAEDPSIKLYYHPRPLEDFKDRDTIAFNDDWETQIASDVVITDVDTIKRAEQYVIDFDPRQVPFDAGSKDAVLLVTLNPGLYTFLLDTKEKPDSGIGLLGIYEIELAEL